MMRTPHQTNVVESWSIGHNSILSALGLGFRVEGGGLRVEERKEVKKHKEKLEKESE
jgi:hypothetical protein